jgi:hypothetical protein
MGGRKKGGTEQEEQKEQEESGGAEGGRRKYRVKEGRQEVQEGQGSEKAKKDGLNQAVHP